MTVQVSASRTDPEQSGKTTKSASTSSITGGTYNLAPALSAISPAAVASGSTDTIITLTGSGFSSSSTVLLNGAPLPTSYGGSTKLTATVPAANLTSLGWSPISVSNPAPGGGTFFAPAERLLGSDSGCQSHALRSIFAQDHGKRRSGFIYCRREH